VKTEVTVIITDVNDEIPTFRSDSYLAEVNENAQANTPITFLNNAVPEVFDHDQVTVSYSTVTSLLLLLLLEALQLQRNFGLLNEFLPFDPVSNAVLPVCYFHPCYIALYIILPSIFRSS
jgi:hypothetical protein